MIKSAIPVLVTRAEPGASETVARLTDLGLRAIKTPVMHVIASAEMILPNTSQFAGLIFTSANGVRAFADRSKNRSQTAWCVGPATAAAAREAGFAQVEESAGDARDLAAYVGERCHPDTKPMLHIANAAAKGDLKQVLEGLGFDVVFCPLYKMERAVSLSDKAIDILKSESKSIIFAHSEKGAAAFVALSQGLPLQNLKAVAISERAAAPLIQAGLTGIEIAPTPNEDGLFKALHKAVATLSA
ncbi:MAG: uroporphyrinogen-III synthase [Pseudomonadota bacterium]